MTTFNKLYSCKVCHTETFHSHLHDAPYGEPGMHESGTERFVCGECGLTSYARDNPPSEMVFINDKRPGGSP